MGVSTWLAGLGMERYAAAFRANDVGPEALAELTDEDLRELGVSLGHRRVLLKAIRERPSHLWRRYSIPSSTRRVSGNMGAALAAGQSALAACAPGEIRYADGTDRWMGGVDDGESDGPA